MGDLQRYLTAFLEVGWVDQVLSLRGTRGEPDPFPRWAELRPKTLDGSGGDGCPSWQKGRGLASNGKRGYPDIAADADPHTGAYGCYGAHATCSQIGGTGLAGPIWTGMIAVTNSYLAAQGKTVGFLAPALYRLAGAHPKYAAFHDMTRGTNGGYLATKEWDEVTGWGSTNLYNLARDLAAMAHRSKQ